MKAALLNRRVGLVDNWLRHIQDVQQKHEKKLAKFPETEAVDRLCELNVLEQVSNVCCTSIAQDAWERGQPLAVHGWIYGLHGGLLKDLNVTTSGAEEAVAVSEAAAAALLPGEKTVTTDR